MLKRLRNNYLKMTEDLENQKTSGQEDQNLVQT